MAARYDRIGDTYDRIVELGFGVTSVLTSLLRTDWHREVPAERKLTDE